MKSYMPLLFGLLNSMRSGSRPAGIAKIPSHKIEQKEEIEQLSKQKMQRMKGKKARKNRGQNRKEKHQDTALYASLRR